MRFIRRLFNSNNYFATSAALAEVCAPLSALGTHKLDQTA